VLDYGLSNTTFEPLNHAFTPNTINGETLMQYSSLDGQTIGTNVGTLHCPHEILRHEIPYINIFSNNQVLAIT